MPALGIVVTDGYIHQTWLITAIVMPQVRSKLLSPSVSDTATFLSRVVLPVLKENQGLQENEFECVFNKTVETSLLRNIVQKSRINSSFVNVLDVTEVKPESSYNQLTLEPDSISPGAPAWIE
jgi:hypothetical protein